MVQTNPPLEGKTVAITRPRGQNEEAAQIIKKMGGEAYFIPTIEIKEITDLKPIENFISELKRGIVDYVVLMSVNGVKQLLNAARKLNQTNQLLEGLKKITIIAVGPRTAEELKAHRVHVDLVPAKYTSEGITESMQQYDVFGKQVRIPRTTATNPTLEERLTKAGAIVKEVHVYQSELPTNLELKKDFLQKVKNGKIDAIVFGSALCATNLFVMLADQISAVELSKLINQKLTVVAIGPVTAQAASKLGLKVDVMPNSHIFEEALFALANLLNSTSQ